MNASLRFDNNNPKKNSEPAKHIKRNLVKNTMDAYLNERPSVHIIESKPQEPFIDMQEFDRFRNKQEKYFNDMLDKREEILYKWTRYKELFDLYRECLQQEPPYIPRKFRNAKYHVMSSEEYACIQAFQLQRFRSECDILRIRRDTLTQKLINGDKEIDDFIKMQSV